MSEKEKIRSCRHCFGCGHVGLDCLLDEFDRASCLKYPKEKGMEKPNCIAFEQVRCPWYDYDGETLLPCEKLNNQMAPIVFHQIIGPKTRVLLAEILLHVYDKCHPDLDVAFRSVSVDDQTAKRLAAVLFERFDVLDATIYAPVFELFKMSSFGPVSDYDQLRCYRFNDSFFTLLKSLDKEQFEAVIKELTEKVRPEIRDEFDIRFELAD